MGTGPKNSAENESRVGTGGPHREHSPSWGRWRTERRTAPAIGPVEPTGRTTGETRFAIHLQKMGHSTSPWAGGGRRGAPGEAPGRWRRRDRSATRVAICAWRLRHGGHGWDSHYVVCRVVCAGTCRSIKLPNKMMLDPQIISRRVYYLDILCKRKVPEMHPFSELCTFLTVYFRLRLPQNLVPVIFAREVFTIHGRGLNSVLKQ